MTNAGRRAERQLLQTQDPAVAVDSLASTGDWTKRIGLICDTTVSSDDDSGSTIFYRKDVVLPKALDSMGDKDANCQRIDSG